MKKDTWSVTINSSKWQEQEIIKSILTIVNYWSYSKIGKFFYLKQEITESKITMPT